MIARQKISMNQLQLIHKIITTKELTKNTKAVLQLFRSSL